MTGFRGNGKLWIEDIDRNTKSFMGFALFFSEKTATTLKSTSLVVYLVHSFLENISTRTRKWLIDNEHGLVGFPPLSFTQEQLKEENGAADEKCQRTDIYHR